MSSGTVVVATRNRPAGARTALASVLEALPPGWRVVVVDQSDGEETADALGGLGGDGVPLQLIRSSRRGLSAGRNDGCRAATGELVLFTDDDCVVDPAWVTAWAEAFSERPAMGIGFGLVEAPPYDPAEGHTPAFDPGPTTHVHDARIFRSGIAAVGMGANMAVRREDVAAAGGFDERLGAGCRFAGAEETDAAYRIARRGPLIGHIPGPRVLHRGGFRPRSAASALSQGYGLGTGAMYAKHIRSGDVYAAEIALREGWQLCSKIVRHGLTGRRPLGARALRAYLQGLGSSLRIPVERRHRIYVPETSPT